MFQIPEKGEFIFRWKIKNFSFATQKTGESLDSPPFVVHSLDNTKWYLSIFPRGKDDEEFIDIFLSRCEDDGGKAEISIMFTIELEAADSTHRGRKLSQLLSFERGSSWGFDQYISRETLLEYMKSTFLPDDILTIQCRIQKDPTEVDYIREYTVESRKETVETEFMWTIRNFSEIGDFSEVVYKDVQFTGDHEAVFRVFFCVSDDLEENLVLKLKKLEPKNKNISLSCRIYVLDAEGSETLIRAADHRFSDTSEMKFRNFCENLEDSHLPDDTLSLRCVLHLETGKKEIKRTERFLEPEKDEKEGLWKELLEDFENMFLSGSFSDVKLRAGRKVIDCHKGIFHARSQVLSDLVIEAEKTAKDSLVIDIDDLDGDTLEQMVYYMYSDKIKNLKYPNALKLLMAGQKYQIISLKRKCSLFLCKIINFENIYDILVVAHIFEDGELERRAISYLSEYFSRICITTEWETFRKTQKEVGDYVCRKIRRIKQL